jgi:hypothetical protein
MLAVACKYSCNLKVSMLKMCILLSIRIYDTLLEHTCSLNLVTSRADLEYGESNKAQQVHQYPD